MPDGGLGLAAVGRSAAAAGGAVVGALIAVPVGSVLFVFLFERVGEPGPA